MSASTSPVLVKAAPKKRRRPAKSCEQCRQRKVKCDLEEPCGPCGKARTSLFCTYSSEFSRKPSEVEAQLDNATASGRSESFAGVARPSHFRTPSTTPKDGKPGVTSSAGRTRATHLESQRPALHKDHARPGVSIGLPWETDGSQGLRGDSSRNVRHDRSSLTIDAPLPCLRVTSDKTRIFNQTHWSQTAAQFKFLGELNHQGAQILTEDETHELRGTIDKLRRMRHTIKHTETVSLQEPVPNLCGTFPSRSVCDELLDGYLRTFQPIYRILHMPTFHNEYEKFWVDSSPHTTAFIMKLAMVLTTGTTFYSTLADQDHMRRLAQIWIHAVQWWLTGPSEKATNNIDGVQVACLLLLARQVTSFGMTNSACNDLALRLAMYVGLHRDPDHFPALTPLQAQMRRQLWYTALELTTQSLFTLSLPVLIREDDYDTKMPANIDDKDIGLDTTRLPDTLPDNQLTDHTLQRALASSLGLRLRLARTMNGLSHQLEYEDILNISKDLQAACRDLSHVVTLSSAQSNGSATRINRFQAQYVDMQLRRYLLMLHRPFVLHARHDPKFYYSRKICLEMAMILATYAKSLNLPTMPSDDLPRYLLNVKGPSNVPLSLDVMTMLGLEILTQLQEEAEIDCTAEVSDATRILAKAARVPIFEVLEHIKTQLHQIIALGSASLKRYGYLSAMLAQLHAMEDGEDVTKAVINSIRESGANKKPLLQATMARSRGKDSVETLTHTVADQAFAAGLDLDLGDIGDMDFGAGLGDIFHFPELTGGGLMEW
ncbi:hypothetical protein LTR78_001088 [Recurvomyces mirabilis]|uniref:Zn(2)-C6 fungal-type domain-containing protein n=1 Tax=Recurvomyces mirabilis TaxID=574656 RepID=A0AAE0WWV8_9PEZI|nr:hypothetical protein LTR78_001088 [Recurvomyces mirabilis]KAK5159060.1 hypothetical protein LTS14_003168 [Recurvomyces mirabilis]